MSATITTATVPNSLPVIQLTINTEQTSYTSYPPSIDDALATLTALSIDEIEYDYLIDTRLLHDILQQ